MPPTHWVLRIRSAARDDTAPGSHNQRAHRPPPARHPAGRPAPAPARAQPHPAEKNAGASGWSMGRMSFCQKMVSIPPTSRGWNTPEWSRASLFPHAPPRGGCRSSGTRPDSSAGDAGLVHIHQKGAFFMARIYSNSSCQCHATESAFQVLRVAGNGEQGAAMLTISRPSASAPSCWKVSPVTILVAETQLV